MSNKVCPKCGAEIYDTRYDPPLPPHKTGSLQCLRNQIAQKDQLIADYEECKEKCPDCHKNYKRCILYTRRPKPQTVLEAADLTTHWIGGMVCLRNQTQRLQAELDFVSRNNDEALLERIGELECELKEAKGANYDFWMGIWSGLWGSYNETQEENFNRSENKLC